MARGLWRATTKLVETARGILFGEQPRMLRQAAP